MKVIVRTRYSSIMLSGLIHYFKYFRLKSDISHYNIHYHLNEDVLYYIFYFF